MAFQLAGAIGTVGAIGQKIGGLLGGGGEKGSGQTEPNTLAHAIDKLDKANDIEALNIAPQAVQMRLNGASLPEVQQFIDQQLGYSFSGPYYDGKWDYINRMLDQEVRTAKRQVESPAPSPSNTNIEPGTGTGTVSASTPTTSGAFGGLSPWAIFAGVLSIFGVVGAAIFLSR